MQIGRRNTTIAFVLLGAIGVGLAIALNITWAIHWRSVAAVVLGIVLFGILIAVLTLNTISRPCNRARSRTSSGGNSMASCWKTWAACWEPWSRC
jgi:hypothetical protein